MKVHKRASDRCTRNKLRSPEQFVAHMLGVDGTEGIVVTYAAGRWRVSLRETTDP